MPVTRHRPPNSAAEDEAKDVSEHVAARVVIERGGTYVFLGRLRNTPVVYAFEINDLLIIYFSHYSNWVQVHDSTWQKEHSSCTPRH
jgi:hypothetical protein